MTVSLYWWLKRLYECQGNSTYRLLCKCIVGLYCLWTRNLSSQCSYKLLKADHHKEKAEKYLVHSDLYLKVHALEKGISGNHAISKCFVDPLIQWLDWFRSRLCAFSCLDIYWGTVCHRRC